MAVPRLIVGLGNPGPEYQDTRHNVGFWLLDAFAEQAGIPLSNNTRFFGITGRKGELSLLKPMRYMNRSGQSVCALALFYKIYPNEILVIHDELDLAPGSIRLKQGGGTAGHNGLKDINAQLGSSDFWRLRLGIGHPRTLGLNQGVADYVLSRPRKEEQQAIESAMAACLVVWPQLIAGDYEAAMRKLHRHTTDKPDLTKKNITPSDTENSTRKPS